MPIPIPDTVLVRQGYTITIDHERLEVRYVHEWYSASNGVMSFVESSCGPSCASPQHYAPEFVRFMLKSVNIYI